MVSVIIDGSDFGRLIEWIDGHVPSNINLANPDDFSRYSQDFLNELQERSDVSRAREGKSPKNVMGTHPLFTHQRSIREYYEELYIEEEAVPDIVKETVDDLKQQFGTVDRLEDEDVEDMIYDELPSGAEDIPEVRKQVTQARVEIKKSAAAVRYDTIREAKDTTEKIAKEIKLAPDRFFDSHYGSRSRESFADAISRSLPSEARKMPSVQAEVKRQADQLFKDRSTRKRLESRDNTYSKTQRTLTRQKTQLERYLGPSDFNKVKKSRDTVKLGHRLGGLKAGASARAKKGFRALFG